jgi:pSer/pThr/pTyr-binding forkhead associated (FHA) protein
MTLNRLFTLIGSAPSARLYLPSKAVSRCHAVIINGDTGLFIRDLASRSMVLVNGQAVREADLHDGDEVQIGPFTFRFTNPAKPGPANPARPPVGSLQIEGLDQPIRIEDRVLLIGRRETADISLTENSASSAHAVIVATNGTHVLRDLNSRTGTFVNGVKIHEQVLSPGDSIRAGETTMRYVRRPAAAPAPADVAAVPSVAAPAQPVVDDAVIVDSPVEPIPAAEATAEPVAEVAETPVGLVESAEANVEPVDEPDVEPEVEADAGLIEVHADEAATAASATELFDDAPVQKPVVQEPAAQEPAVMRADEVAAPSPAVPSPVAPSPAVPSPFAPSPAIPSPAVPSPSVPSPAIPSPAVQRPAPAAPRAEAAKSPPPAPPRFQAPAPAPPKPPQPPAPVAPVRPAAASPSKAAPPPPPVPPKMPARPASETKPRKPAKPSKPPPPRPARPRSPFDLVPSADPDPLEELVPDEPGGPGPDGRSNPER